MSMAEREKRTIEASKQSLGDALNSVNSEYPYSCIRKVYILLNFGKPKMHDSQKVYL